jgi:hypothetical protein
MARPDPTIRPMLLAAAAALAALLLLVAGCGDSKPDYCGKQSELRTAVEQLGEGDVASEGVGALLSSLRGVEAKARGLAAEVKSEYPSEVSSAEASLRQVRAATKAASAEATPAGVARLVARVAGLRVALTALDEAVEKGCE